MNGKERVKFQNEGKLTVKRQLRCNQYAQIAKDTRGQNLEFEVKLKL